MKRPELESVVASMRTGAVLLRPEQGPPAPHLEELAATLPEIFGGAESDCLERAALLLGAEPGRPDLAEVLLLSTSHVHVIQPLRGRVEQALLATAPAGSSVGLILSQVHARAAALESEGE
jgi:hypothetical protein